MSHTALDSLSLRVQAEQIADQYLPPSHTGRSSTLTDPDKIQRFLAYLSDGNYRDTACKASGLSTSTLHRLLHLAESGDEAASAFREAVERTEAQAESDIVRNVRNASKLPQFWAAGATHLERKYPEKWGKRTDDSAVPRVVVQVGGHASDVKVLVTSGGPEHFAEAPFACSTQALSSPQQGLNVHSASDNARYVTLSESVPTVTEHVGQAVIERSAGARFAEGPASVGGGPSSAGFSPVKASPAQVEARRAHRRELQRARRASVKAARARADEKRARRLARQPKEA